MKRPLSIILCLMAMLVSCTKSSNAIASAEVEDTDTTTVEATKSLPQQVTLALVGDIMMGNTWPADRLPVSDGKHLFDDVAPIFQKADVTCGNLEGVIAPPEVGEPRKNPESKLAFMF
ncbi:MAG: CapA family protein, partial [Sodaliphilus sp.]|nr:CapA family protein [Sodaliphilus sp.]